MPILRMDHVVVVVPDLKPAVAFFVELGMTVVGETPVEGPWVDRVNGMADVRVDIVMLRTPDGHGQLELTAFRHPPLVSAVPANDPPNTLGYRSVMFAIDDLDDVVARLQTHGGELIGEIAQYEDLYRLCYLRGPGGIILALAEPLS